MACQVTGPQAGVFEAAGAARNLKVQFLHGGYVYPGFELDPARLQEARRAIDDDRRKVNLRVSNEQGEPITGSLSWSFTITESVLKNYIIGVPSMLQHAVQPGAYEAVGLISGPIEVVVTGSPEKRAVQYRIKGLAGTLRSVVSAGDTLVFSFNTEQRTLSIGRAASAV